ncbi:MAG TPA: DNA internalization-related competence protein ComEC/Rec2 [Labilithrix sp.]|nr:DNA internalization-related competence protein ComEC/Rec2 [Labilithrix sp.]
MRLPAEGATRPALDGVMLVGLGACAGGLAWTAPVATAVATAIVLVAVARRGAPLLALLAALGFLISAARASRTVWAYEHDRAALLERARWPSRCVLDGDVARSPVLLGDALKLDVDVTRGDCAGALVRGLVTLHVPRALAPAVARGDHVEAIAQLAPGYRFWNADTGDPRPAQARRGVLLSGGAEDLVVRRAGRGLGARIDHLRERLRGRILATFPPDTAAMARALVLGEDDLTTPDQRAFRRSGLAHLLAVSGMHLVLVVATFVAALRAVLARVPSLGTRVAPLRVAAAAGVPLAWLYADLAGGSGSAIRAAWMTSIALLAHVLSRKPDTWRAFGMSLAGMAIVDPLVAFDLSFALSAAATAGLLGLGSKIARPALARTPSWLAPVVRALSASLAASIACAPVLACMTADLPVAGLVANLVAVPLGEMAALPLCLAHALLEPSPAAEQGCALAASGALTLVRGVARGFAAVPWGAAPVPMPTAGHLAAIAVGTFGATRARPWWWIVPSLAALIYFEHDARARGSPRGGLRVTFLDVGQGDAAVVDLPDGSAILIDGGGLVGSPVDTGERVIAPVLRARRRSAVALAVLSHPHPDHFGGLRRGLAATTLGALWDTGQGEAEGMQGDYGALLAEVRASGAPVLRPAEVCGSRLVGGARIDVLAPCPDLTPDRGPNDNSFVVRIAYGERSFLFVGDAEHAEEADLVQHLGPALRADVLKVGHHGSRTSTTAAFLAAVDPEIAVVSCGVRNRFGHPAPITLVTLATSRARVVRTDRDGSVTITTDGHSLDVGTAAE